MASAVIPFIGGSYNLLTRKADAQRTVNMYLKADESGTGRSKYFLKSFPGLLGFSSSSVDAVSTGYSTSETRGMVALLGGRAFFVFGNQFVETFSNPAGNIARGALVTSTGKVSIAIGREHVVIVDGANGYAFELATNTFTQISDPAFYGSTWVVYLGGRFIFGRPDTDQFYWSDQDDPLTYDALNFATAESSPDGLVWGAEYREELWLFGAASVEPWRVSANADSAFERNSGVSISVGCAAGHSVCTIDNSLLWIGQDKDGGNVVYMAQGYTPRRVSNHALEESLKDLDVEDSVSVSVQWSGTAFVAVCVADLDTTPCYDVTTSTWFDIAEFDDGDFVPHRMTSHMYAFGAHLIGTDSYGVYQLSDEEYDNLGDTLCRERTSPHYATKQGNRVFFSRFRLICTTGTETDVVDPRVQLAYSNDGGKTYTDFSFRRSLGDTGEDLQPQWNRCGSSKDRVWKLRCTDAIPFDIIDVDIQAIEGTA